MCDKTPTLEERMLYITALDTSLTKWQSGSGSGTNTNSTMKVSARKINSRKGGTTGTASTDKANSLTCYKCGQIGHIAWNSPKHKFMKKLHQRNVHRSGSHTLSSQTIPSTSPVLLSKSRSSQAALELCKVLSDCARAFSGAPECTSSYRGVIRMLWDLTYRIVKFSSSWDLSAALWQTLYLVLYTHSSGS